MEEITLRFEIIRLAVELGDYETIDLQCGKLRSLSLDDRLNEIIDLLESKNFRQALYEMKHYHQSLEDEFFAEKKKSKGKKATQKKEWQDQGLFATEEEEDDEERTLDLEEILRLSSEGATQVPDLEEDRYDLEPKLPQEKKSDEEIEMERPVSEVPEPEEAEDLEEAAYETVEYEAVENRGSYEGEPSEEPEEELGKEEEEGWVQVEEKPRVAVEEPEEEPTTKVEPSLVRPRREAGQEKRHPPISYIGQKFRNMIHQFPPLERSEVLPPEVERMRKQIAEEGYTEEEIEEFLKHYQEYKAKGRRAEAAQVLLLAAATESKFAQFLLARELFKGEVIQKDHAESFTQINTLADQNFAEAICDLGQFYEYGIGIGKDRQMALLLYEEAAELGVSRARKHYERLKNSRGLKGLLGKIKVPEVPIKLPKKTRE